MSYEDWKKKKESQDSSSEEESSGYDAWRKKRDEEKAAEESAKSEAKREELPIPTRTPKEEDKKSKWVRDIIGAVASFGKDAIQSYTFKTDPTYRTERQNWYEQTKAEIERLKAEGQASTQGPASTYLTGGCSLPTAPYAAGLQAGLQTGDPEAQERSKKISELETELLNYERGNGYISKVVDDYYDVTERPTFETSSAYRDYTNPTREQLTEYDVATDSSTWYTDANNQIYDAFGNRIDPNNTDEHGNILHPLAQNENYAVSDRLGMFLGASEDDLQEAVGTPYFSEGTWEKILKDGVDGSWQYLKDTEIGIYYTLLKENGAEVANKFLDDMKVELNKRQTFAEAERMAKVFEESTFLEKLAYSIATTPAQFISGTAGFIEDTAAQIRGEDINPYSAAHSGMHFSQNIRGLQAQELEEMTGNAAIPFVDFTVGDLYQTGMSVLDMAVGGKMGAKTYGALMGMSSTTSEAKRLYEQGASNDQILWGASLAGAAEMLFERYSIEKLITMKDAHTVNQMVKNALVQGGIEASEEAFTEISNTLTNALVMGDQSDWAKLLEENGGDYSAAFMSKLRDVANAGLGGFISGGTAGSVGSAVDYASNRAEIMDNGRAIMDAFGGTTALRDLAMEVSGAASSETQGKLKSEFENLEKVYASDAKAKKKAKAAGNLYRTVTNAITEQNQADIVKSLERKGWSQESAKDIATALVADMKGEKLSNYQESILNSVKDNKSVTQTVSDIIGNERSTLWQRNRNLSTFALGVNAGVGISPNASRTNPASQSQETASVKGNLTTGAETGTESHYEVSADGKTIDSEGNTVSIKGISSIGNGHMILETEDGNTIDSGEVQYASESEALVYETVAQMGVSVKTANILVNGFKAAQNDNLSAAVYAHGIEEAFLYGKLGIPAYELANNSFASKLTDAQRDYVYRQGKKVAGKQAAQEQATVSKKEKVVKKQGKVYFDKGAKQIANFRIYAEETGLKLEPVQETAIQTMEKLSTALGIDFYVFQSYAKDGKRVYIDENGVEISAPSGKYYLDGRIYIDLFAGNTGKGTMLYTVAHELTHYIRQWSPAKFKVLANFLMKQYGEKGVSVRGLVDNQITKAKRDGRDIGVEEAYEEVVADSMETMLNDGNVVQMMADLRMQDKTLWQKICDWFKNLVADLKAVVDAYKGYKPDSAEGKMVANMQEVIVILESLYADALVDAGENHQATSEAQKNTTRESVIDNGKYAIRESMTEQERYEELKDKKIAVVTDSRTAEYADEIASLEALQTRAKSKAERIIKPLAKKLGIINTPLTTTDVEIEFLFTASGGLAESLHKQLRYGGSYVDFAKTLINLDHVLETAVLIETHGDKYSGTNRANKNLEAVYVLFGAFKDGNSLIPVQMEIKKSSDVGGRLYLTVAMTKIEADVVGSTPEKIQTSSLVPASEYSLAELFRKINPLDAHFLKYLPDGFLSEEQITAKNNAIEKDRTRIAGYGTPNDDLETRYSGRDPALTVKINESLTMQEAKQMIQRAFVIGNIKEWYDDEYRNGDEWLAGQGVEEVAMYIENEYTLQAAYLDKIQGLVDEEFYLTDVLEAYQEGTLTGKVKKKAEQINIAEAVAVADPRFYAPKEIENAKELYGIANQKITNGNRETVNRARAQILLYAHNKGAAETLDITPSELNKKLRTWGGYSAKARDISMRINAGAHATNRWTGIESLSWLNKATVTDDDVERMVKTVDGNGNRFQNSYIARTMLALDTHIDWSWLTIKFDTVAGVNKSSYFGSRCNGYYRNDGRLIHVKYDAPNTVAHEMGHALDYQWGRDIGYEYTPITEITRNTERLSGDVLTWFNGFKDFADSLVASSDLRSEYSMDIKETFARFVAKFVEWTEQLATGRSSNYETSYYQDKFTAPQFIRFARLLQEKSAIDVKGLTQNKLDTSSGTSTSDNDVKLSGRDPEAQRVNMVLQKENAKLKEDVIHLKELLKLQKSVTGGTKFTKSSVEASAGHLMKAASARGEKAELVKLLNDFYEYIAKGEALTWEDVKEKAQPAVQWLQSHEHSKKSIDSYAQDILRELRGSRIYLDETQKKEVAYQYGSYNDFRKKTMGSVIITDRGSVSLDSKWVELADSYPNIFDPETTTNDMPSALLNAIDTLRNMTDTDIYGYDEDLMTHDLIRQVYDSYWNVSTLYTVADVKQKEMLKLKGEHTKRMTDLREYHKKKTAQLKAEHKADLERARKEYRDRAEAKQQKIVERWQESRKRGIESREKTAMRHKIKNVVNELNQYLLKGTKDRHVPIELQKAVAEALDAVNMDTVGAEERIAKLKDELLKAKTPEQIQEISRKIDHIQQMGDRMNGRLKKLKDAYDQFLNSDDPMIANSHDEVISNKLQSVIEAVGDTPLRDMTINQLGDVYDMYRMVLTTIRNVNKSFKAKRSESISSIANRVMEEVEKVGGKRKLSMKALNGIKNFGWNNLKPVYAFEHIGSDTFAEVFDNVRSGEDVWAVDITEAREFYLDKSKKYDYDSWDFKKRYGFTSTSGMDFELSLEQIMSLYAYSKREQAAEHLKRGGIVIDETTEITIKSKVGIPVKFNPTEATAYNISEETLSDIVSKLTKEQKEFVDEMQEYLSTVMGAKGNEVSLEMYGVKLFKEKFYFPLKSAQQFMAKAKEQQQGEVKIKNSGFSKETVQKANNPIVLTPFMNVWANHVNEMSMYHAFVLPMEDFYRVYNYKTPTSDTLATESVEMFIQNAYGKGATKYIDQLLKDLNGGARTDSTTGVINKMMGLFKKGAVFASLSVVVQQPSAIARAAALVDTKYFIGSKVDHKRHKALWDEVKQYAPVAIIKEMGYFDTNMGKSTQDFILAKEYSGIAEKAKAIVTDSGYRDEQLSRLPALADEIAWCSIWEAVKRETKANNSGMDVKSDAFLKKAGERFTEVIVKTQVYDSVLSRSGLMRSKDTGMKMATSFMAEPTTSINMVADALLKGKRGNRKYARAAIGAVIASQILNAILVSFVYAGRDDDEDETYVEKYIGSFTAEVLDGMNPLTYIPFVKDIVSIVQGYDVERSDMAVISDLWNAWQNLSKDNVSVYRKVEGFVGSVTQMFGLPVKNIMKDARGIYQTIASFANGQQTTETGIKYAIQSAITGKSDSNQQQLYDAILSGDTTQIDRVKGRFDSQTAIDSAIRKALRENDPRIKEAATAKVGGDLDEYLRIAKQIIGEGHFNQDDVVKAINAEINAMSKTEDTESKPKVSGMFTAEDFAVAITQGDAAMADAIRKDIIQTAQKNGKSAEDAEKSFNSSAKSRVKELLLAGTLSEREAISALVTYCGVSKDDAVVDVQYWKFTQKYPEAEASSSWFDTYYEKVESSGISISVYMEYRNRVSDITGESKKERRMAVIDSLPITSKQKDALYLAEGWAESKLNEAPWH